MCVKDLLGKCNVEEIVDFLVGMSESDNQRDKFFEVIDKITKIDPVETGSILLAVQYSDEGNQFWDISAYKKSDIITWASQMDEQDVIFNGAIETLTKEDVEAYLQRVQLPFGCAFELVEWREILGYEVDQQNLQDCGISRFIALVIYEMTFFGFDESKIQEERDYLNGLISSTSTLEECSDLSSISVDSFFDTIITKDELDDGLLRLYRDMMINCLRTIKALNSCSVFMTERAKVV